MTDRHARRLMTQVSGSWSGTSYSEAALPGGHNSNSASVHCGFKIGFYRSIRDVRGRTTRIVQACPALRPGIASRLETRKMVEALTRP